MLPPLLFGAGLAGPPGLCWGPPPGVRPWTLGVLPPGVTPPPGYPPPPALGVAALPDARGVPDPLPKPEDRGVTDGPGVLKGVMNGVFAVGV